MSTHMSTKKFFNNKDVIHALLPVRKTNMLDRNNMINKTLIVLKQKHKY